MIRRATLVDLPLVASRLRRMVEEMAAAGPDAPSVDPSVWETMAGDVGRDIGDEQHLALLADDGLLTARVDRTDPVYAAKALLHVSAVFVEPAARRQGLARRLLDEAFAWGRAKGCVEARLNVFTANPARELYRTLGFAEVRVEMRRPL